jgi:hypothetical protein
VRKDCDKAKARQSKSAIKRAREMRRQEVNERETKYQPNFEFHPNFG